MLADLVAMAETGSHGRQASALIVEAYGPEALEAIDAALARNGIESTAQERLTRLRNRLALL
jgi:hypothetical protein